MYEKNIYVKREIKKAKRENKEMEHKKSMWFGLRGQHPPQKVIDDFIFIIKVYVTMKRRTHLRIFIIGETLD